MGFPCWRDVVCFAVGVVIGGVFATAVIGRALRWKAGMKENGRKGK